MIQIPKYLQQGDTIGLVCPSGYLPAANSATCINVLRDWGFDVIVGKTMSGQHHYFSGTDDERLADLQKMLDNPDVKAILCGRGGYGLSRIIDRLDFSTFIKHPKWVIGFSDITLLLTHVFQQYNTASIHAPMAAAFNNDGYKKQYVQSLRSMLMGKTNKYSCPSHLLNRNGAAKGRLIGGNLTMLTHLIGSNSAFASTNGCILFIEDVGEYIYKIDRMFIQLKRCGWLAGLAGLIVGGFTDMKDTTITFGKSIESIIAEHLVGTNYPVCFNFPVGHQTENFALKIGGEYCLEVSDVGVSLSEIE